MSEITAEKFWSEFNRRFGYKGYFGYDYHNDTVMTNLIEGAAQYHYHEDIQKPREVVVYVWTDLSGDLLDESNARSIKVDLEKAGLDFRTPRVASWTYRYYEYILLVIVDDNDQLIPEAIDWYVKFLDKMHTFPIYNEGDFSTLEYETYTTTAQEEVDSYLDRYNIEVTTEQREKLFAALLDKFIDQRGYVPDETIEKALERVLFGENDS